MNRKRPEIYDIDSEMHIEHVRPLNYKYTTGEIYPNGYAVQFWVLSTEEEKLLLNTFKMSLYPL